MWQHFSFRCVTVNGGCIQCLAKYSIQNDRKVISPDLVFKISRHYDHMTATKWSRGTCTLYVHRLFKFSNDSHICLFHFFFFASSTMMLRPSSEKPFNWSMT